MSGPLPLSWIGLIGVLEGGLRDFAEAEEGAPVGVAAAFVKSVACFVFKINGVENQLPAAVKGLSFSEA